MNTERITTQKKVKDGRAINFVLYYTLSSKPLTLHAQRRQKCLMTSKRIEICTLIIANGSNAIYKRYLLSGSFRPCATVEPKVHRQIDVMTFVAEFETSAT